MLRKDPFSLNGMVALVTGGGSGLGLAMAECFIASGANVVISGKTEAKLVAAVEQLGPKARYVVADVTSLADIDRLVERIASDFGKLDVLVNNAGNTVKRPFEEMPFDDFQNVMNTHVSGPFYLTQKAIPLLRKSEAASVLYIASMASYLSVPLVIGYTAAKSAVLGLVRGTAAEISAEGIRVNGIAPGWITTPMTDQALNADPERKARIINRTPSRTMGTPEDIGWAATYLVSPAAAFVNGHTLVVDGGAVSGF